MYPPRIVPAGPKKKDNTVLIFGITTVVIIIIIVIVDVVLWSTKKGWFAPYDPPIPPEDSVSPNGNPKLEGSLQTTPGFLLSSIKTNLNQYQPYTGNPDQWGVNS